ncbi:hypothetical protein HPB47_013491 [Ixodes persulcatus]|uniref:Uncharacterized protein n=1 Tax=Ixodes persulcatus TaxID=34615 RepID=A0AC60QYC9_IXOPE|nr:hypothetical protein HPB47_013491 [Ixodes persulcatus]
MFQRSCNDLLGVAEDDGICPTCEASNKLKDVKKDGDFFVVLDINKQLNHIIQMNKPALHEKLSGVVIDRESDASVISDITQAEAYVKLRSSGILQGSDLMLTFTVNELPVPQRFKVSALAGLWFERGRPNMTLFLGKFVEGVTTMEPVLWQHEDTFIQGLCVLRDMKLALEMSMVINGYKGPSPALNLLHFDLVWGFTVEYMHAVLLGVIRQITELLLSSANSSERYYIGSPCLVAAVD